MVQNLEAMRENKKRKKNKSEIGADFSDPDYGLELTPVIKNRLKKFMPKIVRIKDGKETFLPLRMTKRARRKLKNPRLLVRCGCCDQSLEIYYDDKLTGNPHNDSLEINGVNGTVDQWRTVLLPLLKIRR